MKKGDIVKIVKCAYPTPNQELLGKCSIVSEVVGDNIKLERWDIFVNYIFLEKTDEYKDELIEFNESYIIKLN